MHTMYILSHTDATKSCKRKFITTCRKTRQIRRVAAPHLTWSCKCDYATTHISVTECAMSANDKIVTTTRRNCNVSRFQAKIKYVCSCT